MIVPFVAIVIILIYVIFTIHKLNDYHNSVGSTIVRQIDLIDSNISDSTTIINVNSIETIPELGTKITVLEIDSKKFIIVTKGNNISITNY